MTKLNRIISLFLVVVMIVGSVPLNVYGGDWEWDYLPGITASTFARLCTLTVNLDGGTLKDDTGVTGLNGRKSNFYVRVYSAINSPADTTMNQLIGMPYANGFTVSTYSTLDVVLETIYNKTSKTGYTKTAINFAGVLDLPIPMATQGYSTGLLQGKDCNYSITMKWRANTYKVKYNANNGSGSMSDTSFTYDQSGTLRKNTFTRSGYVFKGWAISEGGSVVYEDQASVSNLTATDGETVNLYAVWEKDATSEVTTTVKFNLNGGTATGLTSPVSVSYTSSSTGNLLWSDFYSYGSNSTTLDKIFAATKTGYHLGYFKYTTPSLNDGITASVFSTSNGAYIASDYVGTTLTMTAQWNRNTYTITYHSDRTTSAETKVQTFEYGVAENLEPNTFEAPAGYRFKHWENTGGDKTYTDGQSVQTLTQTNGANINLYAVWEEIPAINVTTTFKFHLNGGSASGLGETTTITYVTTSTQERISWVDIYNYGNNKATLDKIFNVTKSGYVLDYFKYTNPSYDDGIKFKALSPGDGSSIDTSLIGTTIELTAQWITGVSVTLQGGYGCNGSKVVTKAQNETLTFGDPSEYGISGPKDAKFMGWYESYNENTGQGSGYVTGYSGTEPKTFYAVFGYPIILDAHGGLFPNGQERITVYVCKHEPYSSKSPASSYLYAFPDWGYVSGGVPTREGYRRPTLKHNGVDHPYYMLMYGDMTQFTPEGYDQNMTIGPDEFDAYNIYYEVIDGFKTPVFYQQWEPEITYNANGGSGTMATDYADVILTGDLDQYTYTVKENAFTHSTKQFSGWSTNANGSGTSYSEGQTVNNITAPTTLYAQWGTITYTVAYNGNGSTSGSMSSVSHTYGTPKALTAYAFKKTGYTFIGWNTQADGKGDAYADKESVLNLTAQNGATVTLYAQWKKITYTVTYDKNNSNAEGSMDVSTFTYDVEAPLSKNTFTRPGYTFKNWNTAKGGSGTTYTDEQIVINLKSTQDAGLTLYAQWTANTYTVVYDSNGGTGSMTPSEHVYNTAKNLTANAFTRTGYTFNGWNTQKDGSGTKYANKAEVKNLTAEPNGTVTLYAQWKAITYSVKYDANGGSGTKMSNTSHTYDVPLNLRTNTYTYTNKVFAGWNTSKDGTGTHYADGASVVNLSATSGATVTLYAQWTDALYTMTLDPNGGTLPSGYNTTYQVAYGTAFKDICAFPEATKTGYYVDYWMCYNGASYIGNYTEDDWNSKAYNAHFNATMVAHYAPEQYTITLVPGEGAVCSPTSFTVTYDSTYSALPTPTRTGYTFKGWYTGENGTGTKIQNSTICQIVGDDTLYAHWEAVAGTLTFKTQGGSLSTTKYTKLTKTADQTYTVTLYTGDSYVDKIYESVPIPTWNTAPKRQYRFDGWSLTSDGDEFWKPNSLDNWSDSTYPGGDRYAYAQWTKLNSYKLKFDLNDENTGTAQMPDEYTGLQYTFYDGELLNTVFGTHNSKEDPFPKPTRTGYRFMYWELVITDTGATTGEQWSDGWGVNQPYSWGQNVTMRAVWAKEYTLTLNPNGGTFSDATTANKTFKVIYEEKYKDVEGLEPMPQPTRTGYTFLGWGVDNGDLNNPVRYDKPDWGDYAFVRTADTTFYAVWQPNTYHIVFDPNGGSMPNGFTTGPYEVKYNQSVSEAVGGYPPPTHTNTDYKFAGWVAYGGTAFEYTWTSSNTWNYHYVAEDTVTLVAKWVESSYYTVTFHATGSNCKQVYYNYYKLDNNNDPTWSTGSVTTTGATVNNAGSVKITIEKDSKYSSVLSTFPEAKLTGYVLEFWYAKKADGTELTRIYPGQWSSKTFNFEQDVDFYAYYRCDHDHDIIWHYSDTSNIHSGSLDPDFYLSGANPWDDGTKSHAGFFRHHGVCDGCKKLVAFGYDVEFLARDDYKFSAPAGRKIVLSDGVPQSELFVLEDGEYRIDTCDEDDDTDDRQYIVDYLYDAKNPKITVKFDPVVKAAKSKSGFTCWEVDYTMYGYRGTKHTNFAAPNGRNATWEFDYKSMDFNSGGIHSCHLRLVVGYDSNYSELLFDATVPIDDGIGSQSIGKIKDCSIVDSGRKYGILPIKAGQSYKELLKYIPTAKHIGTYYTDAKDEEGNDVKVGFNFVDVRGNAGTYVSVVDTLYCSIAWNYANRSFLLNTGNWTAQFNPPTQNSTGDCKVDAFYIGMVSDKNSVGIARGSLATYYANNKAVSDDYNKAYYDFNEDSGGTMLYKYYKDDDGKWRCEPLFAFDVSKEYDFNALIDEHDTTLNKVSICYPEGDSNFANKIYSSVSKKNTFDPEVDFDYTNFKSGVDVIIAKEPKRYTYYMGEGAYYVFPEPVNDPNGVPYSVDMENYDFDYGMAADKKVVDSNGNEYYVNLNIDDDTESLFKLARRKTTTKYGDESITEYVPVCAQYTIHAKWDAYYPEDQESSPLPMGYALGLSHCLRDKDALGTGIMPYFKGQIHYLPAAGYEDYNAEYGDNDMILSYPEGDGYTHYYYTGGARTEHDMQATFYNNWDFAVKFTSNYPTGKTHEGIGYPTSVSGLTDADVNVDDSNNHYVYQYVNIGYEFKMPYSNLFTCDGYYIDSWQIYDKDGNPAKDKDGKNITIKALDCTTEAYDNLTSIQKDDYILSSYYASFYAKEPGAEFRAVWKRAIELTVVEGGNGASGTNGFATVEYKSVYTGEGLTLKPTETSTVMVRENTQVKLSNFLPAANNVYSYLTLNNNKAKESADRIITTEGSYNFYIIDDTALTVQFAQTGSTTGFYIDRNNKLLRNNDDPWKLYSNGPPRSNTSVADSSKLNNALYYMYKSNQSYSITVEGSNVDAFNKTYTGLYDEVIPLVTDSSGFVGWKFNGEFVSYDAVYRHRITASGTLTAVYSGEKAVVISIDGYGTEDGKDYFNSHYTLPSDCTINETGFIYTTLNDSEIKLDDLISGNESYYGKAVSVNKEDYGSFKLMLPSASTYYVVAYLSYKDKEGNIKIVYSDRVSQ